MAFKHTSTTLKGSIIALDDLELAQARDEISTLRKKLEQLEQEREKPSAPITPPSSLPLPAIPPERKTELLTQIRDLKELLAEEIRNSTLRKEMDKREEERRKDAAIREACLTVLRKMEAAEEERKKEEAAIPDGVMLSLEKDLK